MPAELALPADRPRPPVPATAGYRGAAGARAGARGGWRRWPGEQGVTMFMVIQAALAVLLSRLGAGTDIPVGTRGRRADR